MSGKSILQLLRAAILIFTALILLVTRLHPLFHPGYKKFCEVTKRVPISYLTNICAVASILMFSFGAFMCLRSIMSKSDVNEGALQKIYTRLISDFLSVNLTMSTGYWFLYFYKREFLGCAKGSEYFKVNKVLSYCDHTLPPMINLLEAFFVRGNFKLISLFIAITAGLLYYTLIIAVYHYHNVWPYSLFNGRSYVEIIGILILYQTVGIIMSFITFCVIKGIRGPKENKKRKDIELEQSSNAAKKLFK